MFPNGQDLRPEIFSSDNLFVDMVKIIYSVDTNTNVIPSVHVYGAIAGAIGILTSTTIKKKWTKVAVLAFGLTIIASTCLIKQHSILDGVASGILYAIVYAIIYIFIKNKTSFLKIS